MYLFCISCKNIVATIQVPTLVHQYQDQRTQATGYEDCSQCRQIPYKSGDQVPLQEDTTLQPTTVPGPPQMCTSLQRYVAAYTNINRSAN